MVDIPLILFAKAPIPGKVKTRLQTHCSPQQAAAIAEILLEITIQTVTSAWPGRVQLAVWLDQDNAFIQTMLQRYSLSLTSQVAGDLGQKMYAALQQQKGPAVVMGCDVPHCPSAVLQHSYQQLAAGHNVIGPSQDGGYYLLGMQSPQKALFDGVDWGERTVFAHTIEKAQQANIQFKHLPILNDVDEWQDLLAILPQVPELYSLLLREGLL